MVKLLVLCFLLGNVVLDFAMASDKPKAMDLERCSSVSCSNPPTEAPAVLIRKLGPSMAPESEKKWESERSTSVEAENGGGVLGEGQHSHHSIDKSIAGGGVILGGLATTFLVAVFCYIRATATARHNNGDSYIRATATARHNNGDSYSSSP